MGRLIGAVVAGYVVIFLLVFASFSLAFMLIGPNGAFQPDTYDVSMTWIVVSTLLGLLAAACGGYVCRRIAGQAKAVNVLAGLVVVLGVLSALPIILATPPPIEPRPADIGNLDAMMKARQPTWIALLNPVLGAVGVLLGGRGRSA